MNDKYLVFEEPLRRNKMVSFALTEPEYAALQDAADNESVNISVFLRGLIALWVAYKQEDV